MNDDNMHNANDDTPSAAAGGNTPADNSDASRRQHLSESNTAVFALVGQVGLSISLGAVLGAMLGVFIDSKLHSSPIATLIGLLLGLAAGIYSVYRLISSL